MLKFQLLYRKADKKPFRMEFIPRPNMGPLHSKKNKNNILILIEIY